LRPTISTMRPDKGWMLRRND